MSTAHALLTHPDVRRYLMDDLVDGNGCSTWCRRAAARSLMSYG
jgi:hypothetical protein